MFTGLSVCSSSTQVVIVSHRYPPDRVGIRYLTSGVKIYYIPFHTIPPHAMHATLPQFFAFMPLLRSILIRERIDIIHGHGSLSSMSCEAIISGATMGIRGVLTDHSLYGLGGKGEMWGNKMLSATLSDIGAVVCVSHTRCVVHTRPLPATDRMSPPCSKENTVLRAAIDPRLVYVIPNAVVPSSFLPDPTKAPLISERSESGSSTAGWYVLNRRADQSRSFASVVSYTAKASIFSSALCQKSVQCTQMCIS